MTNFLNNLLASCLVGLIELFLFSLAAGAIFALLGGF